VIDFEEELKKFHPSQEIDQAEEAITKRDLSDIVDVIIGVVKESKKDN